MVYNYNRPMDENVEQVSVGTNTEPFIDDITRNQVAHSLGLEKYSDIHKNQDNIKRLIDWAQAKGAKDRADVVWSIKQLANRVGSPKIGNNWAQHLGQYAYLEMERMKLDNELQSFEGSLGKGGPTNAK